MLKENSSRKPAPGTISVADIVAPDFAVGGFQPFSVSDWPDKIAAVIFAQGCPLRCNYCHNPHLIPRGAGQLAFADVRKMLGTRRDLLDGVVFSGGEPCAQRNLPHAIASVKQMGFKVGLHTAGSCPGMLEQVLDDIDWVGIDIKAPPDQYERITGASAWRNSAKCIEMLVSHRAPFEARTTWHPDLFSSGALFDLAQSLANCGVTQYAVQRLRRPIGAGGTQRWEPGPAPTASELLRLKGMFPTFTLR
jgi:pyruvate formate lyase activating enzyme